MRTREIMTASPWCCVLVDTASKAARIMKKMNTGIVPVVENEESRKLVGVVTDRDLCLQIVAEGRDPQKTPVKDCMTSHLICCNPDDDLKKALELMKENQVRRIPIVDKENMLVGIVSMADIARRGDMPIHETFKKVSEPSQAPSKPRAEELRSA